ncbi:hypothetical protein GCM10020000_83170 [Streptomyces olivoverticillatus]
MKDSPAEPTFARLREVLESRFEVPADSVTQETPVDQLGLDSLELVELTVIMEVKVDPADFSSSTTLGEIVSLTRQHQALRTADSAAQERTS